MYHMTVGIVSANKSFCYSTFAYALSVETEVLVQNLLSYFNENKIFGKSFLFKTLPLLSLYKSNNFFFSCVFYPFKRIQENRDLNQGKERRKRSNKNNSGINTHQFNPVLPKSHIPLSFQVTLSNSKSGTKRTNTFPQAHGIIKASITQNYTEPQISQRFRTLPGILTC